MKITKQLKLSAYFSAILLLLIVGVAIKVKAQGEVQPAPAASINNVENMVINQASVPVQEDVLGAVASLENAGPLRCFGDDCTYSVSAPFIDASTTIFSVASPFLAATSSVNDKIIKWAVENADGWTSATTTVELVRLNVSGPSTSTYKVFCSSAPNPYATSSASIPILETGIVNTSTIFVAENNISSTYSGGIGGGSVPKIMLSAQQPYLICNIQGITAAGAWTSAFDTGFTGNTNTFDGVATVRFSRPRF